MLHRKIMEKLLYWKDDKLDILPRLKAEDSQRKQASLIPGRVPLQRGKEPLHRLSRPARPPECSTPHCDRHCIQIHRQYI